MDLGLGFNLGQIKGVGGGGDTSLGGTVASTVFDLDATQEASYDGVDTTKWQNLAPSPADGAAQSDYDMFFGEFAAAQSDDPTFTGTVGDDAAYMLFDGGDYFQIAGGNTSFLEGIHDTGGVVTVMVAMYDQTNFLNDTWAGVGVGGDGWLLRSDVNSTRTRISFRQGGVQTAPIVGSMTWTNANPTVLTWTIDIAAAEVGSAVNKGAYGTTSFTSNDASSVTPTDPFRIGSNSTKNELLDANTRIYAMAMFNEVLSTADRDAVIDVWEARHARSYT